MMNHTSLAAIALLAAASAVAAPPLTTIQDVLYKADGSRFNGIAVISWSSFEAPDTSNITTQTLTVKITEGSLRVQLVPTTSSSPSTYYSVKYNSDGKVQFEETWAVPSSATPLRVRDVRVPAPGNQAVSGNETLTGPIQESDVVGLAADLNSRPLKSPGYAPGRAVFVNSDGALESVSGSASDCVRVDGSSGPCGGAEPAFVDNVSPTGIVDGNNRVFALAAPPSPAGSLVMYRNGVLLKAGQDYTLSGQVMTFIPEMTPQPGDTLLASYRMGATDSSGSQIYPVPQVLCSGVGALANTTASTNLGICTIPAGMLVPGDRIEIRFDLAHQGTASAYGFEVRWGSSTVISRTASAADAFVSGRVEAAVLGSGAQMSYTSWGTALPFTAGTAPATDSYNAGLAIQFFGQVNTAGSDSVSLQNFTVVRFP